jgi:DNA-binding NarL/FixJ family response regulator
MTTNVVPPMHTLLPASKAVTPMQKRRILIVDDHSFFAACLRTLLDNESDLVVCDVTTNSIELGDRVARLRPDLLVIDLTLGAESGLQLGKRLRELHIRTPILFISTLGVPSREDLAGVPDSAFITKSRRPSEFLSALREILAPRERAGIRCAEFSLARARGKA